MVWRDKFLFVLVLVRHFWWWDFVCVRMLECRNCCVVSLECCSRRFYCGCGFEMLCFVFWFEVEIEIDFEIYLETSCRILFVMFVVASGVVRCPFWSILTASGF